MYKKYRKLKFEKFHRK